MTESDDNTKMYYFVDESGDPNFFGRGKINLLEKGLSSKYFMVGYLELLDPQELHRRFQAIRDEVAAVDYVLWAIHRVYNYQDFRYYRYLGDKIHLVYDLNFGTPYYGTYYTQKKPLGPERFSLQ